jgi:hypothetical protein
VDYNSTVYYVVAEDMKKAEAMVAQLMKNKNHNPMDYCHCETVAQENNYGTIHPTHIKYAVTPTHI